MKNGYLIGKHLVIDNRLSNNARQELQARLPLSGLGAQGVDIHIDIVDAAYVTQDRVFWVDQQFLFAEPTREVTMLGVQIQAPAESMAQRLLEQDYGANWRVSPADRNVCKQPSSGRGMLVVNDPPSTSSFRLTCPPLKNTSLIPNLSR